MIQGKRGNTTSTFYSGAGDGAIDYYPGNTSWDTAHDATDGLRANPGDPHFVGTGLRDTDKYWFSRIFLPFDTSALSDTDAIDSAVLSVYEASGGVVNGDNDGDDWFNVVQTSQNSPTTLVVGDYDQAGAVNNPTEGATRIDVGSISASAYNSWTLNPTGLSWIDKTGFSKLGLREGHDAIDSVYAGANNTLNSMYIFFSEEAGTTKDPVLVVQHYASAPIGVRKTATQTTSADTTTDDDSELAVSLAADSVYDLHGVIFASSTSQVPDIKVAFTAPTGATIDIAVVPSSAEQAELLQTSNSNSDAIPVPSNQPIVIEVMGTVKTSGSSGLLKFQWSQNQSDAAAVGVLRGSYLRVDEI